MAHLPTKGVMGMIAVAPETASEEGTQMPAKPRSVDTGKSSFFGDMVYNRVIRKDHFLVALNELFPWAEMSAELIKAYRGQGVVGRRPYDPVQIFKMLFLAYLYGISERDVEEMVTYHLVAKWFVGLAVDEDAPDHSTLSRFKARYLKEGHWAHLRGAFDWVIREAMALGLEMGQLQVLDSTHTQADVNADKDDRRQKEGNPPRDEDAGIVNKGKRDVVEPDGKRIQKELLYKGYKTHASVNVETGIVTGMQCTRGNQADNKQFPELLAHDQALGLPNEAYGGDAAYDDTDIYVRLAEQGLRTAICLPLFAHRRRMRTRSRGWRLWLPRSTSGIAPCAIGWNSLSGQPSRSTVSGVAATWGWPGTAFRRCSPSWSATASGSSNC